MGGRDGPVFDCLDPELHKAHLQHGIILLQELDKAGHDTALDDPFSLRVFLLGKQLPELRRSVQLAGRVVRKNILDHLFGQLVKK